MPHLNIDSDKTNFIGCFKGIVKNRVIFISSIKVGVGQIMFNKVGSVNFCDLTAELLEVS